MHCFEVYQDAFQYALHSKTFALAHLHRLRLPMSIDTTGCCKLFYFTSGNKSFHIDQWQFSVEPGDLFWINQNQWHYFSQADSHVDHDRYVLFIHPAFLKSLSTEQTDLSAGFSSDFVPGCRLNEDQQQQMAKLLEALTTAQGFGEDVLQLAAFLELMVFIGRLQNNKAGNPSLPQAVIRSGNRELAQIQPVLQYINNNADQDLSLQLLCELFYLSPSYLCRIFKKATGTTVHQYIIAKRITLAKELLAQGYPVTECCMRSGFRDYSCFLRSFVRAVGVTPKKYANMEKP